MITVWSPYAQLSDRVAEHVRVIMDRGVIMAVETGADAEPGDRLWSGMAMPGFANAHSHAFHRALRGRTHAGADGGAGTFWTWREQMYALARQLDPERYRVLARAVFAEMVCAGITAVGEFHYLHHDDGGRPYADPNVMNDALAQAAAEAGIRLTLLDVCYLSGGLTAAGHLPLDPVQWRFSDGSVEHWADRARRWSAPPGVVHGAAVHSVRAVPEPELARFAALATDGPLHVHLSEQPAENAAVAGFYGGTPTDLLHRHGLLTPRTSVVHATHLTATDIERLGSQRVFVCGCPTTERDLADGIGPMRTLADVGCRLTIGTDQHAMIDIFEELRGLELHERLVSHRRGHFSQLELITAGTVDGHRSLGRPDGGRIAVGAPADLIEIGRASVRTAGSRPDQLIFAASAADVRTVIVGGDVVVADGRHRLGAVGELLDTALADLTGPALVSA